MFNAENLPVLTSLTLLPDSLEKTIDFALSHPNVRQLMNEKFDAVVVEVFHSEALLGKCRSITNYSSII